MRKISILICATLVAGTVRSFGKEKPYKLLIENSPFLSPAFKARLGKRDKVALSFIGYTKIADEWYFAVVEKKEGKASWMKLNVDYGGVKVERFDEAKQQIHVTVSGLGIDLALEKE